MMSSWLTGLSSLQLKATQDIRLKSVTLLGFRHSLVARTQRLRAHFIASTAYNCQVNARQEETPCTCQPDPQTCVESCRSYAGSERQHVPLPELRHTALVLRCLRDLHVWTRPLAISRVLIRSATCRQTSMGSCAPDMLASAPTAPSLALLAMLPEHTSAIMDTPASAAKDSLEVAI